MAPNLKQKTVVARLEMIEARTEYSSQTVRVAFDNVDVLLPIETAATADSEGVVTLKQGQVVELMTSLNGILATFVESRANVRTGAPRRHSGK